MKRKSLFFEDTVIKSHKKAPTCLAESSAPPLLSCKGLLDLQLKLFICRSWASLGPLIKYFGPKSLLVFLD